jgi:7-cyano-7-deazaguanine synthase
MVTDAQITHRVLLSGGVDSAAVLAMLVDSGQPAEAVWVDYSQAAREAERLASREIAKHFSVSWSCRTIDWGIAPGAGEIYGRNDALIATSALGLRAGVVSIGIHAGSGYPDCTPEWAERWQKAFDHQSGGTIGIAAPLVKMQKGQVYDLALSLKVPVHLTYSCEAATTPCGSCRSCRDREALVVRA